MSERLSSVEIEDVLSSIRRLVSEDLRPGAKAAESQAAATPAPAPEAGVGKLVLTPAHRITPEPEAAAPEVPPAPVSAGFHSTRASRITPVPQPFDAEEEEDLPPPVHQGAHDWFEFAGQGTVAETTAAAEPVEDAPVVEDAPMAEDVAEDANLTQAEAAEEVLAGDAPAEPVMEAPYADGPAAADAAGVEDWLPEEDPTPVAGEIGSEDAFAEEARMPDPEEPAAAPSWMRAEPPVVSPEPVEAVAEPIAKVDEVEEDWADAAEAEIRRELEEEVEVSAFSRFEAVEDRDEPVYDEEMLRDLVRDIIREELQGALGERITRNVRKLVRAEIARALAVRDFE